MPASEAPVPTFEIHVELLASPDLGPLDSEDPRGVLDLLEAIDTSIARANAYFQGRVTFTRDTVVRVHPSSGYDIATLYEAFTADAECYDRVGGHSPPGQGPHALRDAPRRRRA